MPWTSGVSVPLGGYFISNLFVSFTGLLYALKQFQSLLEGYFISNFRNADGGMPLIQTFQSLLEGYFISNPCTFLTDYKWTQVSVPLGGIFYF